ncbi:hypothetical protein [Flavobacterium caeni]|uniref:Uncharacterized protein n=1 Tax=Flavobacterium caeni TaxID=490189 RepID=A0A1G5CEA6_9FLAO|nr:hypothetical protein [Flavobacterium caeni]SCY00651.1 hypothetical protein SAMN02927903_00513 [Flavobacterium caeni]
MKFVAKILLFVFVAFLATPTVVSMIEKSCDTSIFYSMSEEELTHKDVKAELKIASFEFINLAGLSSGLIHSENLSKHDNVSGRILIPPPEQV